MDGEKNSLATDKETKQPALFHLMQTWGLFL